jgi:hypothetical protein
MALTALALVALAAVEPENAMTIIVELPDTAETSEMKLEFGADVSLDVQRRQEGQRMTGPDRGR